MKLLRALAPYVPAVVTMTTVLVLYVVYQRELGDWFAGRALGEAALAHPRTLDVGPLRVAYATRPAVPVAGEQLELFLGVGDRMGALQDAAAVTAGDLAVERRPRGQFTVVVPVPLSGDRDVALTFDAAPGHGALTLRVRPGKAVAEASEEATGIAWWTCSMHPSVHAPEDGLCPICSMDLTPVTYEELRTGSVRLDARRRQLIGVTTAPARRGDLHLSARATAVVKLPETQVRAVSARAMGFVERVDAPAIGAPVQQGDLLAVVSSPDLFAAQADYLAAGARDAALGLADVTRGARERLRLLGYDDGMLKALARAGKADGRFVLRAPVSGVLLERNAVPGAPAGTEMPLFKVASLDPIWVEARVHETDAALAEVGASAHVTVPYLGGAAFDGRVSFVAPALDSETRTLVVRVELPNPTGALKVDMLADVTIDKTLSDRLIVPADAVIWAGPRRIVFVEQGEGFMRPVTVEVGARGDDAWEIVKGLSEGDAVVTSGHFLLGAESRLRSALGTW